MAHTYVVKLSNNKLLRICEKNDTLVIGVGVGVENKELCKMTTEGVIVDSGNSRYKSWSTKTKELVSGLIESEETSIEYLNIGDTKYLMHID